MTKISQLADIGGSLAANDEFVIRDVSDGSTPNKKVTASGLFLVGQALGIIGNDNIIANTVASGTQVKVYASGISGYSETTVIGIPSARTTISGYFENASGVASGVFYPVVTQVDIGTAPNQVPLAGMLGDMAFQNAVAISVDQASITTANIATISSVPLLSGGGIQFPATQVASANANTLDDYEEGTWTPTIIGTTTAGTGTYAVQQAKYTKIGRMVYIQARIDWSAHTGTGNMRIGGLPFAVSSSASTPSVSIVPDRMTSPASTFPQAYALNSTSEIVIVSTTIAGGGEANLVMDTDAGIRLGGCYEA